MLRRLTSKTKVQSPDPSATSIPRKISFQKEKDVLFIFFKKKFFFIKKTNSIIDHNL
jgi:hypothetical protein